MPVLVLRLLLGFSNMPNSEVGENLRLRLAMKAMIQI